MKFEIVAQQIIDLKNTDLTLRDQLIETGELDEGYHPAMEKMHNENAAQLNDIIDHIGYPTIDKVGEEANAAAWLIIQHAISQPRFMKKCLKLLDQAVQENQASPIQLAYLSDRISVFEGRPQRYGIQFDWDENGELSPNPYDDLESVNRRRKALGLNTLAEQTIIIRQTAALENQHPPKDLERRNLAMDAWRKRVGWI